MEEEGLEWEMSEIYKKLSTSKITNLLVSYEVKFLDAGKVKLKPWTLVSHLL